MKKTLPVLLFIACFGMSAGAQAPALVCGFEHFIKMKRLHDPHYYEAYNELFRKCREEKNSRGGGSEVYVIPVVFHIVYNTENGNLPDSIVHSQLQVLNEDYRRMNANAEDTRDIFVPVAADCGIEFQLASVDPGGNPTTGITHNLTDRSGFEIDLFSSVNTLDEVKHASTGGVEAWDPDHYINIWVCNIEESWIGQIFGLSYPPGGLENWMEGSSAPSSGDEGIIVHYTTVGRNNPHAGDDGTEFNNMGRTLTHEMGHYLGLRHTWGDELFTDICSEDDGIDDTPVCGSGDQYSCDFEVNSCDDGTISDQPDMLENYMDYTRDECYNMFTHDQRSLMRYVLEELRPGLLTGVGISEKNDSRGFAIWPNPASDILNIGGTKGNDLKAFTIYNVMGSAVHTGTLTTSAIDISFLAPGIYSMHMDGTKQFIKR